MSPGKNPDEQKKLIAAGALVKPTQAKIISPIPTPKKNCVMLGINYREHVDEGARARQLEIKYPDYPVFFTKPATSVIGQFGKVIKHKVTDKLDWEVELALIIGKKGRDIPKAKAYDYVFGYTICLDMTARELQRIHGQWFKGKALDTLCPLGPWIVHKSAMPDPQQVRLDLPGQRPSHAGRQHSRHDLRHPDDHRIALRRDDAGAGRHHQHRNSFRRRLRPRTAGILESRRQGRR